MTYRHDRGDQPEGMTGTMNRHDDVGDMTQGTRCGHDRGVVQGMQCMRATQGHNAEATLDGYSTRT